MTIPRSDAVVDINVTPLIDVMLVLLIIFMVVTPVATRGLDTALPERAMETVAPPPPALVLRVEESAMTLNRTPVATLEDLEARLRDVLDARTDRTLFVSASGAVPYGRVVEVMDVARGAGIDRMGIVTERSEPRAETRTAPLPTPAPRTPQLPSAPRP